jgi:Domain of unknown function (DUF4177)
MNGIRWTYETVVLKPEFWTGAPAPDTLKQTLNDMGQKGWELVSSPVTHGNYSTVVLIFKRPQ